MAAPRRRRPASPTPTPSNSATRRRFGPRRRRGSGKPGSPTIARWRNWRRAFVVNIGDLMARWSNDRWVSTLHRVVLPEDGGAQPRQSFAFFHQPNWEAEIASLIAGEPAKYAPVRSGPYLMSKFQSTTK